MDTTMKTINNNSNRYESLTLYHGSKSGIHGNISPISRKHCDFGKGFYMGTERIQPLTLICNYPSAILYTLHADLSELKILDLDAGMDWALLIAYNRNKMENIKNSSIYKKYENMSKQYDMIVGNIANDRMFVVLDRFFHGEITDIALIQCLSALKLGKQYVALTQKACNNIDIIKEEKLSPENLSQLKQQSELNRQEGITLANEICRKYRREGQFFDEIIMENTH